jgi:hypothetical protein
MVVYQRIVRCDSRCNLHTLSNILANSLGVNKEKEAGMGSPGAGPEIQPVFCGRCGNKLTVSEGFCNRCGSPIHSGDSGPTEPVSQSGTVDSHPSKNMNFTRKQVEQVEEHRRAPYVTAAILTLFGWILLANKERIAFSTFGCGGAAGPVCLYASPLGVALVRLFGMVSIIGGIVLAVINVSKDRTRRL